MPRKKFPRRRGQVGKCKREHGKLKRGKNALKINPRNSRRITISPCKLTRLMRPVFALKARRIPRGVASGFGTYLSGSVENAARRIHPVCWDLECNISLRLRDTFPVRQTARWSRRKASGGINQLRGEPFNYNPWPQRRIWLPRKSAAVMRKRHKGLVTPRRPDPRRIS